MSLIGSLEDLSLGDILQIISLSQKSGVLVLRTDGGEGRIVFRAGLVSGASTKCGPRDLRGVLVGGGFVAEEDFAAAESAAASGDQTLEELLVASESVTAERLDSLRRESVESAVIEMFRWSSGDFSFDVREVPDPEDPQILLQIGVNAQYLAMEAARYDDESDRGSDAAHDDAAPEPVNAFDAEDDDSDVDEMSAHEMFGVAPDDEPDDSAPPIDAFAAACDEDPPRFEGEGEAEGEFEADGLREPHEAPAIGPDEESRRLAVATLADAALRSSVPTEFEAIDDEPTGVAACDTELELESESDCADDLTLHDAGVVAVADEGESNDDAQISEAVVIEPAEVSDSAEATEASETAESETRIDADAAATVSPAVEFDPSRPVVVIDADLGALEWTKSALADSFDRIHIFQRSDLGLTRIRQYLSRAVAPIVLLAPDTPGDRLSGIRDSRDFVRRLKLQASRTHIVWLQEDGARPLESVEPADAAAIRPAAHHLQHASAQQQVASLSEQLVSLLRDLGSGEKMRPASPVVPPSGGDLESLKLATQQLRDASSRGEVLPLVIDFASKSFRRVAMWMIRDGVAVGMAGRGLEACGGPGDDALRAIAVSVEESSTLSRVVSEGRPVAGAPNGEGDMALAMALGDRAPSHFYLAPIESAGRVVAVVYGDDLPGDSRPGDTSALEVVLHHAGLALDRATLERALAEAENDLAG